MNWTDSNCRDLANAAVASSVSRSSSSDPMTNIPWILMLWAWNRSMARSILSRSCFFWKSLSVRGLMDSKPTYTLKQLLRRMSSSISGSSTVSVRTWAPQCGVTLSAIIRESSSLVRRLLAVKMSSAKKI